MQFINYEPLQQAFHSHAVEAGDASRCLNAAEARRAGACVKVDQPTLRLAKCGLGCVLRQPVFFFSALPINWTSPCRPFRLLFFPFFFIRVHGRFPSP